METIGGQIVYTDVTELDVEEKAWLFDYIFPDIMELDQQIKKQMFLQLWNPDDALAGDGTCVTCGANEGKCMNTTCIRTRVTNKLHLNNWSH